MTVPKLLSQYEINDRPLLFLLDNLIWPILVLTFAVFSYLIPGIFTSQENIVFLLYSSATLGMLALGEAICLLSGHFDLSIGSIAGFSAMFTALFVSQWFPGTPVFVGILLAVAVGGFIGVLNGVSVAYLDVNPFLQTLSFLIIFEGAILFLSTYPISDLPDLYLAIGGGTLTLGVVPSIPYAILLMLAAYALAWFFLRYTRFGIAIYAVGGDSESATEAGINTELVVVSVYALSGMLSGIAGLILTGFLGSATPSLGTTQLFPAFTAVVIGGVSLFGGRGNVINALGGVLLIGTVEAGLVMLRLDAETVQMIRGSVLLSAILLYSFIEKHRRRTLSE